ncbi:DUF2871 domain-containing protein [Corynebacterium mustelae]|nr:DUF2871 domain-containing protein [Corynebacterium mustelae]
MQKLFASAASYTVLGLLAGVFYREFTRAQDFVGVTRLSTLHTHLLVLGTIMFLVLLALSAVFKLHEHKQFTIFFIVYNVGVLWTTAFMVVKGINQVLEPNFTMSPALAGVSGFGHIILTIGFFQLFMILGKQLKKYS